MSFKRLPKSLLTQHKICRMLYNVTALCIKHYMYITPKGIIIKTNLWYKCNSSYRNMDTFNCHNNKQHYVKVLVLTASNAPVSWVLHLTVSTQRFQCFSSQRRLLDFQLPASRSTHQLMNDTSVPFHCDRRHSATLTLSVAGQPYTRLWLLRFLPVTQYSSHHNTIHSQTGYHIGRQTVITGYHSSK